MNTLRKEISYKCLFVFLKEFFTFHQRILWFLLYFKAHVEFCSYSGLDGLQLCCERVSRGTVLLIWRMKKDLCRTYSSYFMRLAVLCRNTARLCHAQSIPVLSQSNILSHLCPTSPFPKSFSWWNTKRPLDNFGSFLRRPAIALVCSFIHAEDEEPVL